jgi:predicted alpha/beta-fold hydrolase
VYQAHFLRSLRRKAEAKLRVHPGLVDARRLSSARTIRDFDDAVTARIHGFADADDYYRRSSSIRWLEGIHVPTLLLSSGDDPFLPADVLREVEAIARRNPALQIEFPERGGHVGFVSGRVPWQPVYWADRRIADFLAPHLEQ